jgi:hypothetical protein
MPISEIVAELHKSLSSRPVHANERTLEAGRRLDGIVDALRLAIGISVLGANDDAAMRWLLAMQANEIAAIDGEQGASIGDRVGEYVRIRYALIIETSFAHCQYIMAELA